MIQNSYIFTPNGMTLFVDQKLHNINSEHPNYVAITSALRAGDWESIKTLLDPMLTLREYVNSAENEDLVFHGTYGEYKGRRIPSGLFERIKYMQKEGFDFKNLLRFLDNLYENPSATAINETYDFLTYGKLPITSDGHFLAFKRVRDNYKSVHDNQTDNSIGTRLKMNRNEVDDNRNNTCSYGLHFCSHEYLSSFGGERIVVLKINPRDVVSIPIDYNNTKGRACEYLVVGEIDAAEHEDVASEGKWTNSVVDYVDNNPVVAERVVVQSTDDESIASRTVKESERYRAGHHDVVWDTIDVKALEDVNSDYARGCKDAINSIYKSYDEFMRHSHLYYNKSQIDLLTKAIAAWNEPTNSVATINASVKSDEDVQREAYLAGYKAGRKKRTEDIGSKTPLYVRWYNKGYSDGVGHKRKFYK